MAHYTNYDSGRRAAEHSWVMVAWVLPLVFAIGFSVATAGFGAITIPFAIMIGVVATVLHLSGRDE